MKKILILLSVLFMVITMVGCSQETDETSDNSTNVDKTDSGQLTDGLVTEALSDTNGYYVDTFKVGEITEINIEISEEDWNDLCENAVDETYYPVDITVNGTMITDVGFRAKGSSSLTAVASSDSDRYGFKVKFDEYVDDQTLNGLDMMVLNGSFSDPSYMREYLAYAASAYLDCITPYASYTKLSINGEYFGLYLSIEAYKDSFVERITADDEDAILYKADGENCTLLTSDDASGFDIEVGEDEGNTNILNLIAILNNTTADNKEELENILDVDSVLKAMAVNFVTGNYDSYNGSKAHNYYLLYTDGKFEYIPWDYNMAFGGFSEDGGKSVTVDVESPFYNVDSSKRPLMEKLLAIEEYKERYLAYVDDLCDYFSNYEEKITDLKDLIYDDVKTDPTAFYTIEQFENNITASDVDLSQSTQTETIPGKVNGNVPPTKIDGNTTAPSVGEKPEMTDDKTQEALGNEFAEKEDTISNQTVSIVDYIEQHLDLIEKS